MAFVEFKDVRKIYTMGEVQVAAVDGMSFEIEQGELVVVVGPSGSGKTTLLNMMGGMDSCTSGSITLDGARVYQFDEKQLTDYRRYDIGFVFQFYNLVQNLTALENVTLPMEFAGIKDGRKERASELLRMVGLSEDHEKKRPIQLSGGEQQRVAIARSLSLDPEIILGDEPTGNLDSENSGNIISILQKLAHEQNKCVIVVTHSSEVCGASDVRFTMRDGQLGTVDI